MDETEPEKQRNMITKSSIKRKPLADLTNIKSNNTSSFFPSKKPGSSAASDSSIGSTQNPIYAHRPLVVPPDQLFPSKPQRLKPGQLAGDENRAAQAQRQTNMSKTKAAVQERRNNVKEGSVSLCSSTLNKIKDQGKVNQSCSNKMVNDGKKVYVAPHYSSTEKINDKRKSIDAPLSAHYMKIANNSTQTSIPLAILKLKDNGKESVVQSVHSLPGNSNENMSVAPPESLMKIRDKGKAVAVSLDHPSRKKLNNNMMEFGVPLKGVIIKEREGMVTSSSSVNLAQKDEGQENVVQYGYSIPGKSNDNMSGAPPEFIMKIKDKGKAIAVPLDYPSRKKLQNNMMEFGVPFKGVKLKEREGIVTSSSSVNLAQKDKGKENVLQSGYSLAGNSKENMAVAPPESLMKIKDKGKAIAVPFDYPSRKPLQNNMMEFDVPLKGVKIKEREGIATGSSSVNLAQKDKGKGVFTPINHHTLKKKDQADSCPPILRTMSNRNDADAREDAQQSKLQTEPPPNKKKRRCSTKEEYTLPQDYVEQQRAYFKEIDDFELQVEEV
ncbi:hypothetical protein SSX86_017194 [Deinandra increscens subsp. villosa]|uniref:Sororin C-terminal region domain-containing protein n=1 Tax=Deinandra increscens subsp. villosa TaxID=3103831 RepID=A0AAP0D1X3_9ASTR